MNKIDLHLQNILKKRREEGLLRQLPKQNRFIDFCSNDYLGLSQHPNLFAVPNEEMGTGATGSRLISGNSLLAEQAEQVIAKFHHAEAALIFNSGYMANIGLLSCISDKHSLFLYDELVHSSIIDGMRLGFGKRLKFKHNSVSDLEKKLKLNAAEKVFVVVESVYSMDGDIAPLADMVDLCQRYDAALIVDEAHATGLYGPKGEGLVPEMKLEDKVWARVYTFGKALGLHGAVVVGSALLQEYLINYARSFIYTTALPPHLYKQIQEAYRLIEAPAEREKLFDNIAYYCSKITSLQGLNINCSANNSPIQYVMVPGNENVRSLSRHLSNYELNIKAIMSPTVAPGTERLRICLHSFNTFKEIDILISAIRNYHS